MSVNPVTSQSATKEEIREYLSQRGMNSLYRQAGFIPQKIRAELSMPQVSDTYTVCVDAILSEICDEQVIDANPRTPYLALAWHLVGSDNEKRLNKSGEIPYLIRLITLMSLYIASGASPQVHKIQRIADYANGIFDKQRTQTTRAVAWIAETLLTIASINNKYDVEEAQWAYSMTVAEHLTVIEKAEEWSYIDDVTSGQILQTLLVDSLPSK